MVLECKHQSEWWILHLHVCMYSLAANADAPVPSWFHDVVMDHNDKSTSSHIEMKLLFALTLFVVTEGFGSTTTQTCSTLQSSSVAQQEQQPKAMFASFANEENLLKESTFPIAPDDLMKRAKEVLSPSIGIGTKDGGACLADNFEFVAAVVGPLPKSEYLDALGNFNLEDSFDMEPNFYGMSVDPYQPNRVWFFNRLRATHTGDFFGAAPTGKEIEYPPQVQHLDFNEEGLVKEYGFYTADRRIGNTGGLGGAFGLMYAVGKPLPIPECQPYSPSLRFRLLQLVGGVLKRFSKKE